MLQRLALHIVEIRDELVIATSSLQVELFAQYLETPLALMHIRLLEYLLVQVLEKVVLCLGVELAEMWQT